MSTGHGWKNNRGTLHETGTHVIYNHLSHHNHPDFYVSISNF